MATVEEARQEIVDGIKELAEARISAEGMLQLAQAWEIVERGSRSDTVTVY